MKAKLKQMSTLLMVALLVTSCGDKNKLKKLNPFDSSSDGIISNTVGAGLSTAAQYVASRVRCQGSSNQRITSQFVATGSYHDGYQAQRLQAGSQGGNITSVAVGVSYVGDIIEVRSMSNGQSQVLLHMCHYDPLIIPGKRAVSAAMLTRSLVVKSRPGCQGGDEVTSAWLMVRVPTVQTSQGTLYQADFPVTFSRYEDYIPGSCNN